jgi:hypothetical protein
MRNKWIECSFRVKNIPLFVIKYAIKYGKMKYYFTIIQRKLHFFAKFAENITPYFVILQKLIVIVNIISLYLLTL